MIDRKAWWLPVGLLALAIIGLIVLSTGNFNSNSKPPSIHANTASLADSGNAYTPLSPYRLLDTRTNHDPLTSNSVRNLVVTGVDGVPTDAEAVVLNLTVTDTTTSSFLSAYPESAAIPGVSNMNWSTGETVPNLAVVEIGNNGAVSFFNDAGSTDLIVDLEGYFAPETYGSTVGSYAPLTPARICDTRNTNDACHGVIGAGVGRNIQVTGQGGVPSTGVTAALLNVTVTDTTAASDLVVYPQGETQPTASNLNWPAGDTVANRVLVPVSASGQITVENSVGNTDVIVDVDGYFTNGTSTPTGLSLYAPISPIRLVDTRSGATDPTTYANKTIQPNSSLTVQMGGVDTIPSGVTAVVTNVTASDTTASSFLTVYPTGTPGTSDINWSTGQTIDNLTVATLSSTGSLLVYNDAGKVDILMDAFGYFFPEAIPQTVSFTSTAPTNATVGGATYTPSANASSKLTPNLTIDSSSSAVCAINSGVISFQASGTCTIDANQQGNANYLAAPQVQQSFLVGQASLTITASSGSMAYGGTVPTITASYVGFVNGNTAANLTTQPTCSTTATISSPVLDSPYISSCSGAADSNYAITYVNGAVAITKAPQSINYTTAAPNNATVGGTAYDVAANSSSGLTVSLTIDPVSAAICSISAGSVGFQESGTCTIDANQSGSSNYNAAAQIQQSFTVIASSQVITFTSTPPSGAIVNGTYNPTANSSSGLTVALTIDGASSNVCSIAAGVVTFNEGGTCTVDANQSGDGNYSAAPQVQQSFTVAKADQTLHFTSSAPSAAAVGGASYTPSALSNAALPVSISIDSSSTTVCSIDDSGVVTFQASGICIIDANQAGNSSYSVASQVQQSFSVAASSYSIALTVSNSSPNAGQAVNLSSATTGFTAGDYIVLYDSSGNFSQMCTTSTCSASDTEYASDSYTASLYDANNNDLADSTPITVTWPGTLALSVDNDNPNAGVAANFTGTANDFSSGDTIYIYDSLGNFNQTCTSSPCAVSDTEVGSDTYTAYLYDVNGNLLDSSSPTSVIWTPITISLSVDNANPSSGEAVNLTATPSSWVNGYTIYISDTNGGFFMDCNTEPCDGSDTEYGSDSYTAILIDSNSGEEIASSNTVMVNWPGTLILTSSSSAPALGAAVTLTATANGFVSGDTIYISGSANNFNQSCTDNPCVVSDIEYGGVTYTAYLDSSTEFAYASAPIAVTWPSAPTLSLSVDSNSPGAGVAANLLATATNWVSGDQIIITDTDYNLYVVCNTNPCPASDTEYGGDSYTAYISNPNFEYYLATSNTVTVTWPQMPQTITFTTAPSDPQVGATYIPDAYDANGDPFIPVLLSIDASTPLVCTYDSTTNSVSFIAPGVCTIDANQAGDSTYAAGFAQQSFTVVLLTLASSNYGPLVNSEVTFTATASSPGTISYGDDACSDSSSCSVTSSAAPGSNQYTVTWTAAGNPGTAIASINVYGNILPNLTAPNFITPSGSNGDPLVVDANNEGLGVNLGNSSGSVPTQLCSDVNGSTTVSCSNNTITAEYYDLTSGSSVSATINSDGSVSANELLGYSPSQGEYIDNNYDLIINEYGQNWTSPVSTATTPLGFIGPTPFDGLFYIDPSINAPSPGTELNVYETISYSPWGAALLTHGLDAPNPAVTCEATTDYYATYCGQYSYQLFLQLRDQSGNVLGYNVGPVGAPLDSTAFSQEEATGSLVASSHGLKNCTCADPVNMESGNLYESYTDMNIPGRGLNLNVTRSYNSLNATTDGAFGYGWTSNLGMSLTENSAGSTITIMDETGSPVTFSLSSGVWSAPAFNASTLVANGDDTWTYSRWNGDSFIFNADGQLISESDRNNNITTFTYNGSGQLDNVTDASGRTLTITWSGNNIAQITDPAGQSVSYTYDGSGNLIEVTNQAGQHTYYTYDSNHNLQTIEDPDGNTTTNTYNSSGQVITQTDALSNTTTFSYTSPVAGQSQTLVTDPDGNKEQFIYTSGLLVQQTQGYGTSLAAITSYTYDANTLGVTSVVDPDGNMTTYTYDSNGNLLTATDGLGNTTTYTYNNLDEPLTIKNAANVTTTNTYDNSGNLLTTSTPLLNGEGATIATQTTTYAYNDSSNPNLPTSITDPDGNTTTYAYDSYGDLISSTNAAGDKTTYTYDILGRKLNMVSPDGNASGGDPSNYKTIYTYNALNEVLTTTDPNGNETINTYDADGNLLTTTDAQGNKTVTTYNADNEPAEVQSKNSSGGVLRSTYTTYDGDNNVLTTTDGNGNVTSYMYNALNQQTSSTNPLGKTTSYTYDGDNNQLTETEANGDVITNNYNAGNELTSISYSDGTASVSDSYNDLGQKLSMTDGTGTSTWTYNSLGQEASYTNGAGAEVQYEYDLDGNQTTIIYPGVKDVNQIFNNANEITSITDWNGNESTFSYDASGNLMTENLANGITNNYGYDQANNLTSISDVNGSTTIFAANYTLNSDNLITNDTSQPNTVSAYQYTALNQVCYAGSTNTDSCGSAPSGADAYSYDGAGNLTNDNGTQQEYNAGDELCWSLSGVSGDGCGTVPSGATSYAYNSNGDLTGISPSSGSATAISYNAANQMTSFELGSGAVTTYSYDGDGLRQSEVTSGTTTEFTWNDSGSLPSLLQQTSGSSTTSYIYGPTGLPLEEILPGGDTYYYSQDSLGSTRALTDSSGAVADTYTYDPYGNITASTGSVLNNLLYDGQYLDNESGFYYLLTRYYDPALGEFLTVDPLVEQTRTPYLYVAGDPLNATDITGLSSSWYNPLSWTSSTWETIGVAAGVVGVVAGATLLCVATACIGDIAVAGGAATLEETLAIAETTGSIASTAATASGATSIVADIGAAVSSGCASGSFVSSKCLALEGQAIFDAATFGGSRFVPRFSIWRSIYQIITSTIGLGGEVYQSGFWNNLCL